MSTTTRSVTIASQPTAASKNGSICVYPNGTVSIAHGYPVNSQNILNYDPSGQLSQSEMYRLKVRSLSDEELDPLRIHLVGHIAWMKIFPAGDNIGATRLLKEVEQEILERSLFEE